jgi:alkylation response protein AidB-like acyl-CoA dehydrogenase
MSFLQEPPALAENQYTDDRVLQTFLARHVPPDTLEAMRPDLERMGALAAGPLHELAIRHRNDEPRLVAWDAWGRRVDRIEVNDAWKTYQRVAAREGLVAAGYERQHGAWSRLHQFSLVYLFAPSSQTYTCPLAMTDGCARTLEVLGPDELRRRVFPHLVSRDPESAWTSGQWMTERSGGSDVGRSETVARLVDDSWRLYGTKWFTSAVTSEVTLTLARPEGNGPGGKGLALFFVELRDGAGGLRNISVNRLKDKLGTRHLPTAELTLDGTPAEPVAGLSDGIRNMASMLNITRTWNAVCAVAGMRRSLALARDFAKRRVAFGARLAEKPLHLDTLAGLAAEYEAAFLLTFHELLLLGRAELGVATAQEISLLRVIQPLAKLLTAKQAVAVASEVLECFGGAGYVEDTGLPALLRDSQVLPIWEGTTNVLSLETLRALSRENAWQPFADHVRAHAAEVQSPALAEAARTAVRAVDRALSWCAETGARDQRALEAGARRFAITLGRGLALALLASQAEWSLARGDRRSAAATRRFLSHGVEPPLSTVADLDETSELALG